MRKLPFLLLLLLVSAGPALAANPDLEKALKLYDSLDYMPALDALQAADARPDTTVEEKVQIRIYIGMISIALGDEGKARTAFARAIALDPMASAPRGASPKVAAILDQLRPKPAPMVIPLPQPPAPPAPAPPQAPPPVLAAPSSQAAPPAAAPYASTQPPPAAAAAKAPTESGSSGTWAAVTGVTALVLGAAGVGAGVHFQLTANNDVTAGNAASTAAAAANDQANANQAWTYTLVGYVAGGILAVGGLTLLIVYAATPSHPAEPHAGQLSVTPRGLALSF